MPAMLNFSVPRSASPSAESPLSLHDHTHAHKVGAVNALVALGDHGPDAEQCGALGSPGPTEDGPVLTPGQDDQGHTLVGVLHGRFINGGFAAVG